MLVECERNECQNSSLEDEILYLYALRLNYNKIDIKKIIIKFISYIKKNNESYKKTKNEKRNKTKVSNIIPYNVGRKFRT